GVAHLLSTACVQEPNQQVYRTDAQRLASERIFSESGSIDPATAKSVFDRMRVINPRIDIYLLDREGRIIVSSGRNALLRQSVDLEPVRRFLDEDSDLPILGDDPSGDTVRRVFSGATISFTDGTQGYLYF